MSASPPSFMPAAGAAAVAPRKTGSPSDRFLAEKDAQILFDGLSSVDILGFSFGDKTYQDQLAVARAKTGKFCAVDCFVRVLDGVKVVWLSHDFAFMGGSLGCAEGEKLTRALEHARNERMPVVIDCRSGGARMQEGTLSLMQMAKVSVAVQALRSAKLPLITVCQDPTYGGVSASYAMQGDVRIGIKGARIGFAGPAVILNTCYQMKQDAYDAECPQNFQSAQFLQDHGQLDVVIDNGTTALDAAVSRILAVVWKANKPVSDGSLSASADSAAAGMRDLRMDLDDADGHLSAAAAARAHEKTDAEKAALAAVAPAAPADAKCSRNYTHARQIDRVQCQDIVDKCFTGFVDLAGDGSQGRDMCLHGGLAMFEGKPCVVLGTYKGHTPDKMQEANHGMPYPSGYRTALRLMRLAEHFRLPLFTLIDTVGAYPSFQSEINGQSEAIATNLTAMASLTVPIVSLVVGEGGSGGALAIGMGNCVGMLSRAYYSVISPEGAASILGRYKDEAQKKEQFPKDCQTLAGVQHVYADQLQQAGVIDTVLWERPDVPSLVKAGEPAKTAVEADNAHAFDQVKRFFKHSLMSMPDNAKVLIASRYARFRKLGKYQHMSPEEMAEALKAGGAGAAAGGAAAATAPKRAAPAKPQASRTLKYVANQTLNGQYSAYQGKMPATVGVAQAMPPSTPRETPAGWTNAKQILDRDGPEAVAAWVRKQTKVLITDTTMRDAHQSLLATRVRTVDLLEAAEETSIQLRDAFSLEMWGGATFDVCYRFLHEDPWERLRKLRAKIPNVLFQMLIRGSNAVGYTSYPDNVVEDFVRLAAKNGMDVFRIFDCFNDLRQMELCIKIVRECKKIAEVCICFTGNFLSEKETIYTLDYYKDLAKRFTEAGAHMIAVKDMAGLLKPQAAEPLMKALREVTDLPIHYHCHNTSSANLATCLEMAKHGCDIIDCAMASMADMTSQPSLNAFLSSLEGTPLFPGIDYMKLEKLDLYWAAIRDVYAPFESGLKAGTARVYDHEIPGGQYSNLVAQCKSMGIWDKWEKVLDMYRDVNQLFGNVVKVTPSSKCVGDMALFLVTRDLTCDDVRQRGEEIDFPASVKSLMMGELSVPHLGFPPDIQKAVLRGAAPLSDRPGALLPPVDLDKARQALEDKYLMPISDEWNCSAQLYPQVFADYMKQIAEYGDNLQHMPSAPFFYGLRVGEAFTIQVPAEHDSTPTDDEKRRSSIRQKDDDIVAQSAVPVRIVLDRVGPLQDGGQRTVEFLVGGKNRFKIMMEDKTVNAGKATSDLPQADASDPQQLASPMPGVVEKVLCKAGQSVVKGTPLVIVSAMKMAVEVAAPQDCVVKELLVKPGSVVDANSLVARITMQTAQQGSMKASQSLLTMPNDEDLAKLEAAAGVKIGDVRLETALMGEEGTKARTAAALAAAEASKNKPKEATAADELGVSALDFL